MNHSLILLENLAEEYNKGENKIEIRINEPMSRHTTFRIGGSAALYLIPQNVDALIDLCGMIRESGVKFYILGNGSNILFADDGFDGAVVSMSALNGIQVKENNIVAESGAYLMNLCKVARDAGLEGIEFAYGIPGSVGGAVYMNAGAYEGEISHVLKESTYLDLNDLTVHVIPSSDHEYGYRESIYRHHNYVILSANFELQAGETDKIGALMNDYMNRRISKQPLDYPSAGSIFKRCPGRYTGQMIEKAGLKGYSVGGAQVSEKHAGFIINRGDATAADVLALIEHIKHVIFEKFGCTLECEMIYVK